MRLYLLINRIVMIAVSIRFVLIRDVLMTEKFENDTSVILLRYHAILRELIKNYGNNCKN